MAVIRKGKYWYYEWQINGKKVRRASGYRVDSLTREEVREREEDVKRQVEEELSREQVAEETDTTRGDITLSQGLEKLYNEHWSTLRDSEKPLQRVQVIIEILGDKPLKDITSKDIAYLQKVLRSERNLEPSTVNLYTANLNTLLTFACRYWEVIEYVPLVKKFDVSGRNRTRVVTWEEEAAILKAAEELKLYTFKDLYIVYVDTGLRRNEALTLTYSDIDFTANVLTIRAVHHKNKRAKTIPMTSRVREVLLIRQKECPLKPFQGISAISILEQFKKCLEKAGIGQEPEPLVIHSLRHTFANRLLKAGVPIYDVKELLGHASIKTTEDSYAHVNVGRLKTSMSVLDNEVKNAMVCKEEEVSFKSKFIKVIKEG